MFRFGWIRKIHGKAQQVEECLKYFAVSGVSAWREQYERPVAAYRAAPQLQRKPGAVSAWLRQGERQAALISCREFSAQEFELALVGIRELTQERSSAKFLPRLVDLCRQAGVAVVIAPTPRGCPVDGATKWLSTNRALILLSLRGQTDDKFWFTFFHEAAHLLKHGKRLTFLDTEGGLDDREEQEANEFARDFLISKDAYLAFVSDPVFSAARIKRFALQQNISASVVVGRLQFDKHLPWSHLNVLKKKWVLGTGPSLGA